jgi:diguanylate cyclase (GGDEF)-like protein
VSAVRSAQVNRTDHAAFLRALDDLLESTSLMGPVGLVLVRLRHFDRLNARLGYAAGDAVLSAVATRLTSSFSRNAHVMRIGASKFAVVLRGLKNRSHCLLAASKIERLSEKPVDVSGQKITVDFTQGIAIYPEHADSAEQLLQCAEAALNAAAALNDSLAVYSPTRDEGMRRSEQIESTLARALGESGIEPYFQAQVRIASGERCGAEALLRCRDASGAFIPPETLIQAAERTGQLGQVTSTMLNAALRYAANWPRSPGGNRVSVNVSAQSLKDPELCDSVASAMRVWGTTAEDLTIEVTESALMDDPGRSFDTLRELRRLGVRVAIDDFGTGYSSLSYFKNIPANELKVDKSFVFTMLEDSADRKIVETVINLAHAFGLEVVAEGVEDEATYELLSELSCDVAQGYLIGKPISSGDYLKASQAAKQR